MRPDVPNRERGSGVAPIVGSQPCRQVQEVQEVLRYSRPCFPLPSRGMVSRHHAWQHAGHDERPS
jgi:hypothetical protein